MPILGVLASSISGNLYSNSFESISTTTVGAGGSSTITFSSIPQTYTHLQIRYFAKDNWAPGTIGEVISVRLNSDTGSNYRTHYLYAIQSGAGTAGSSTGTYFGDNFAMCASNLPANTFGYGIIDFLDYTNTNKYKTAKVLTGVDSNKYYTGNFVGIGATSGVWLNTSAISTITLAALNGTLQQYSSFALYGFKG